MTEPADETFGYTVYRVAVRWPPFWPDRPALWFAQAKEQFELAAVIRQRTKFKYLVSQLHQHDAAQIVDIITSPVHDPNDRRKAELVCRLSTSREQRVKQLHSHGEIGDPKPSHFLWHLTQAVPDGFPRAFWASRLLPQVQVILASQTEDRPDSTSHLADSVCDVTQPTTSSVSPSVPDNTAGLLERVEYQTKWRHCGRYKSAATHTPHTHPPPAQQIGNCTLAGLTNMHKKQE